MKWPGNYHGCRDFEGKRPKYELFQDGIIRRREFGTIQKENRGERTTDGEYPSKKKRQTERKREKIDSAGGS